MVSFSCSVCSAPIEMFDCHAKRCKYHFCTDVCKNTPFIEKVCIECGKSFLVTFHGAHMSKLCSTECRNARNRKDEKHKKSPKIELTCLHCGIQFFVRATYKDKQKYCSQKCSGAAIGERHTGENGPSWKGKVERVCEYCGKTFETFQSRSKQKYCCKEHSQVGNLQRLAQNPRTNIELAMAKALKKKNIAFAEQVPMFGKFLVDFKLDDYPIIVQCDGDYWHNRPHVRSRDKGQDRYLAKAGYMVLRFDDAQILNNINGCLSLIKAAIKTPSQSPLMPYV